MHRFWRLDRDLALVGTSIRTLAEYLGHADPTFTLRTYTHLMPSSEARAREAVDTAFEHLADSSRTEAAR